MISSTLKKAIHDRQLVPFVGAGLSAAVKPGLFPTWPQLINHLAQELDSEEKANDAAITRGYLGKGRHIEAAGAAYSALGKRHFNEILRRHFDTDHPSDVDLSPVNALWRLTSHLVITTNYDSVLSWANPSARRVCNHQRSELAIINQRDPSAPAWIWHLHGHIEQADTIILAPEQYDELYRDRDGTKKDDYSAALFQFRHIVSSKTLLFVGYGLSDDYIMPQLKQLMGILAGVSSSVLHPLHMLGCGQTHIT